MKSVVAFVLIVCVLLAILTAAPAQAAAGWTNESGPFGGRIEAIEYFGAGHLIAGTRNGGVFLSHDAAATWQAANTGLSDLIVTCAVVNPSNTNTAFIGTSGGGVFRTRNLRGETAWTNCSYNIGNRDIQCIAMCRADTNTIFAGTVGGIFKGTAGGGYWTDISSNLTDKNIAAFALPGWGTDTIYVGTAGSNGGVFKTTNGGATWTLKNSGFTNPYVATVRADPSNPNLLIAGTSGGGVFKTTNGGGSWTAKNSGLGSLTVRFERPEFFAVHVAPPFVVLNTPPPVVPAIKTLGFEGSARTVATYGLVKPLFLRVHVAPPFVVLNTPPFEPAVPT